VGHQRGLHGHGCSLPDHVEAGDVEAGDIEGGGDRGRVGGRPVDDIDTTVREGDPAEFGALVGLEGDRGPFGLRRARHADEQHCNAQMAEPCRPSDRAPNDGAAAGRGAAGSGQYPGDHSGDHGAHTGGNAERERGRRSAEGAEAEPDPAACSRPPPGLAAECE